MSPPHPTTIAVLGADTVVGRALCARLDNFGYGTIAIDAYPTGVVDELLEGAELLLIVPRLDTGVRKAFLGAMGKSAPQKEKMPVISLSTTATEEGMPERGVLSVPWPNPVEQLVNTIEAALLVSAPNDHPQQGGLLANGE